MVRCIEVDEEKIEVGISLVQQKLILSPNTLGIILQ